MQKFPLLKVFVVFVSCLLLLSMGGRIVAAEEKDQEEKKELNAVAGEDKNVSVGRKVLFDASKSTNNQDNDLRYEWDFGDGSQEQGLDALHVYEEPGEYIVTLTVDNGTSRDNDMIKVSVYDDLIILLTDKISTSEEVEILKKYAARQNVLLIPFEDRSNNASYIVEGRLVATLLESREDIRKSDMIILWTEGSLGLDVLARFAQEADNISDLDMEHKGVISITDSPNSNTIARIAQVTFNILQPEYILLTKKTALNTIIDARTSEMAIGAIREAGIDSRLIGVYSERAVKELGITNFFSYTVNYLVNKGVKTENIILLLMLPIIATIIAFARQFLGIKTFGIYTPSIITLSFVSMGLKYGLVIFLAILVSATLLRLILSRLRLLYLPRMAIVLTVVAFIIIAMFVLGAATDRTGIIALSVFPILVLITLVEKFISVQIEKGAVTAILLSLETLIVSIVCYYIVNWETLKTILIAYPEVILLTIVINLLLGKWVGLRISEYFRFRSIKKMIREKQ